MSQFAASWSLSRKRFVDEIAPLSQAQLNWRLHPDTLTIGEMALHVAGVESWFASQVTQVPLDSRGEHLAKTATEGVVNDHPFPFAESEITPDAVADALSYSQSLVEPLIAAPTQDQLGRQIQSALGPIISGEGALARLGFHAAYHQGQAYLIKTAPGFPSS